VVNSGNQPAPPFLVARIALPEIAKQVDTLGQLMLSKFAKLPDGATTCQRVAPPSVVAMIQPVAYKVFGAPFATAKHVVVLAQLTPVKFTLLGTSWGFQFVPPSVVPTILVSESPTAAQTVVLAQLTDV
jgi:hypothetical protein